MLGLDDYGSDSESEGEPSLSESKTSAPKPTAPTKTKLTPSNPSSNGLSLPAPKAVKKGGTKKILVELPKPAKRSSEDEDENEKPVPKKLKLDGGRGASGLLSMLPAPKRSTMDLPPPQKVLGGGRPGIVYSATSSASSSSKVAPKAEQASPSTNNQDEEDEEEEEEEEGVPDASTASLLPPSLLLKGKGKAAAKPPPSSSENRVINSGTNFFSLGSSLSSTSAEPSISGVSASSVSISAAPAVEDFRPPSPTPQDEYPGYYQLPSGKWAMHEPEYYKKYTDKWAKEYEAQIRAYEKGIGVDKGFEGVEAGDTSEVNALDQMDEARRVREERMELTKRSRIEGERQAPNMTINPQKIGGLAGRRHQLHSLLAEAYTNREAIEEKIAQGKRNRKEAGNKYGFR